MNFNNQDFVIRILLVAEFLILVLICCIVGIILHGNRLSIFIVINGSALVFIYSMLRYNQSRKMGHYVKNLNAALKELTSDLDKKLYLVNQNEPLAEVYEEIEHIREHFLRREKNRQDIINIVNSAAVNMDLAKLLEDLMPKLLEATGSNCGVFYLANNVTNKLEIKHSVGFSKNIYGEFDLSLSEGLANINVKENEIKVLKDIPDDTVYVIRAFLGKVKPKNIMSVPIVNRDQLVGVFLFASIYEYTAEQLDMVDLTKYYVGAAVDNSLTYEKSKRLSNELKFQNRLIQNLNEDLEKNVRDRTLFLNDIIDSIKDYAIYAMDKDGTVLAWNNGAENLFGFSAKEVVGKNIEVVYTEEDVKAGKLKKRLNAAINEGKYSENGWRTRKDGSRYYAEMTLFGRYDTRGNIIGFTNVTKDITALKNVENLFWFEREFSSKILEESTRALAFTNEKGEIQMASQVAHKMLNSEFLAGQKIGTFFNDQSEFERMFNEVINSGRDTQWQATLKTSGKPVNITVSVLVNLHDNVQRLFFQLQ